MIKVTRLNDSVLMINVEMIRSLQATPDTVITFSNNDRIIVKEPMEEVSKRIVDYLRAINSDGFVRAAPAGNTGRQIVD